ncbi:flagellar biosynthesis protein FlhA [Anaeromyxobacter dehalogenans 2CP-1]|uniref:Flagellar biosynthesis protein FlhA n=1 Tax=Anaeromyxobacter dehalogenans (strain ATCC BAA-258 / DSM 21875 / 2CP-1) TaxID=455488 RepID=B8JD83_ANAD2|nr:flagellar biosynthesis protein FlhA [Anaeromyxobacter dehalogenans]ACL65932.1 flagellar biosynthesis protein FlhA [Anaeromyxobacter dehalogenans 2CP-1]
MSSTSNPGPPAGGRAELAVAIGVLGILAILIVPLPPAALDVFLALSIGLSVLMLLVALGLTRAVEFSVFPSLLLLVTLFRLALNVATTRLILTDGGKGAGAAGHLIETFGRFAVGGSLVVGLVVFLILLIVNFTVITKGSNRVSEVAARFTLDALPGKQMAIDADLAAGLVDDREARGRRQALERETEFFGAMDGASKFVRGDAVAGLAITGVNIVGGLLAGLLRDHLSLSTAAETYTLLTVGDGLVSQMPALLVSTAAGLVVTRAAGSDLGTQVASQMLGRPVVLRTTAGVLVALGLLPGMPLVAFGGVAGALLLAARRAAGRQEAAARAPRPAAEEKGPERIQDLLALDALELGVGYGLVPLIDLDKGGELPGRVTALRRQLATDLGIVLPPVHLRDDLRLDPGQYRVLLRGVELGRGLAHPERLMALDPNGGDPAVEGVPGVDPAFGLRAVWITPADRPRAEALGLTLVDAASVITTHLSELLRRNAHEIVGRQEVQELLGVLGRDAPKLVEDVVPGAISLGELVRVVRGLLREGVSVRDLRTVLEAVADAAPRSKEPAWLVEAARRRLSRQLTARAAGADGVVRALTLDRSTEETLRATLGASDGEAALAPDVETARRLVASLESGATRLTGAGQPVVLLAPPDLRRPLFDFASRFVPDVQVLAARELAPGTTVEPAGTVQAQPQLAA